MSLKLKNLLRFLYINDLASFVHTRFRVDTMRHLCFAGFLIKVELRRIQGIMSATLTRSRFGVSSFWIRHNLPQTYLPPTKAKPFAMSCPMAAISNSSMRPTWDRCHLPYTGIHLCSDSYRIGRKDLYNLRCRALASAFPTAIAHGRSG